MNDKYREQRTHGSPLFQLQVYSHRDRNGFYLVPYHWHDEIEIIYVEDGSIDASVRSNTFSLEKGQICFVNSGELHQVQSFGTSLHHAVVFHPNILDFELFDACQSGFIQPVTHGLYLLPTLLPEELPGYDEILGYLKNITALYHQPSDSSILTIKIRLLQIIERLFQSHSLIKNTWSSEELIQEKRLKLVIQYMKEHYHEKISLHELSSLVPMNSNYFCKYFKAGTGRSPIEFLKEYRIEQAARMLRKTADPITDISLSCGFDNHSYFIRQFKACKGVTPREYRRLSEKPSR